ncbi:MAG: nucleotidyl transferase AbiEii/AbiGii toxin family protein [Bacteroidetes bacterium]|nr:nucleotidyl transferase AbiEii/AbiGii toxin family protein [Bacteroidota bacterium]
MYITDPAAEDIRPTMDIDISLSITTLNDLENLRLELLKRGFSQTSEDSVICRFRYKDIKVDVMNTIELGWAPANKWFAAGFENRESVQVMNQTIFILSLPYFLASKFVAYNSRGANDPRMSHDFEDIVYIIDNHTTVEQEILKADEEVCLFLKNEFVSIQKSSIKQEAIESNLAYIGKNTRFKLFMDKVASIIQALN